MARTSQYSERDTQTDKVNIVWQVEKLGGLNV